MAGDATARCLTGLLRAAEAVRDHLNARIDAADIHAVPVFMGLAELHAEIIKSRRHLAKMNAATPSTPDRGDRP